MIWIAPSEKDTDNAALEKRLWDAADQFRANSGLKSQEYPAPVLGLIFLRFAEVRFAAQRATLEKSATSSRRGSRVDEPAAYHAEGILYYECLNRSSQRWHEGKHELTPWMNFLLAIICRGYAEFENRAGEIKAPRGAKTALVEQAINAFPGQFSIAEIERICPGVSRDMLRHILNRLQRQKQIRLRAARS